MPIRTSDLQLDVETIGDGPTVVFIHGAGGSPGSNFPFLDHFARNHTVIAPHLPGSGTTPLGDQPLTTRGITAQISTWLARAGVGEYAVVGYSMGSAVALEIAAAEPDRVTAIAVTAGFAMARPSLLNFVDVWDELQQGSEDTLGRAILAAILKPETLDARGHQWIEQNCREVARGLTAGTRHHLDLIRSLDVRDALAATTQPLLVVTTQHDQLVAPGHSDDILAIRPDAIQVMLDSGHAAGDEDPHTWHATLEWFLDSHVRRGAHTAP